MIGYLCSSYHDSHRGDMPYWTFLRRCYQCLYLVDSVDGCLFSTVSRYTCNFEGIEFHQWKSVLTRVAHFINIFPSQFQCAGKLSLVSSEFLSGLCEQYVESLGLMASGFDFLFARALVHCDNKPLQNWSLSRKHRGYILLRCVAIMYVFFMK